MSENPKSTSFVSKNGGDPDNRNTFAGKFNAAIGQNININAQTDD